MVARLEKSSSIWDKLAVEHFLSLSGGTDWTVGDEMIDFDE